MIEHDPVTRAIFNAARRRSSELHQLRETIIEREEETKRDREALAVVEVELEALKAELVKRGYQLDDNRQLARVAS